MRQALEGFRFSAAAGNSRVRAFGLSLIVVTAALTVSVPQVEAGCGCDKPPPPPAEVRPYVAYTGTPVSLFSPSFALGEQYTVTFANGISGATVTVQGQVVSLRDLSDGRYKPQLVVALPRTAIGPTNIMVTGPGASPAEVVYIDDTDFTVAPDPIAVPGQSGSYSIQNYQAAVARDGTVFLSLDVSNVQLPLVVEAQALGYVLRFGTQDVVFHNVQGFLMQQLVQNAGRAGTQPVPGMFVFPAVTPDRNSNSDILHYSRHEFETYFLQHQERQPHALDPTDPNWHLDGTRHVDHNHLIVAVKGQLNNSASANGSPPAPGMTPMFTLKVKTFSLFYQGLVGDSSVTIGGNAVTDAFSPASGLFTPAGDVFSNGSIALIDYATVNGSATADSFAVASTAKIAGPRSRKASAMTFMQVKVPAGIPNVGAITLGAVGTPLSQTIAGPGSFLVSSIAISGKAELTIDNSAGPVSLYVTGSVQVTGQGRIRATDPDPEKFAIYLSGTGPVNIAGNGNTYGVVYAPNAAVGIQGNGQWYGALVGKTMTMSGGSARVHYFSPLRGQ